MKRLIIVVGLIIAAALSIAAAPQNNTTRFFIACNHEELTVDNTAGGVSFDVDKINSSACGFGAASVTFTVTCSSGTDCPIRLTLDGTTTVTTTVGLRLTSGQSATIYAISNLRNFRAIREGATSAVLNTIYYR